MSDDDLNPICSHKMSDHIGDSKTTTAGYKQIQNIEKQNDETLTKMKFTQDHFKSDQEKATTHEDSTDIISKEIFSNAENAKHENEADYASVICGKVLQDVLSTIGQNVESTDRVSSNVCEEATPNVGQNDNIANEPESKKDDVDNYTAEHQPTIISSPVLNDSLKSTAQAIRHPLALLAEVALDSTKLIFDKFDEKERDEILSANDESKIDESQTIKIDTVEKDTTETVTFGTNIVESKTNESNTVQNKTIESKTIENNTVENKTVESNNIESNIVESNNVENKTVESNNIESNIVESNSVENKTVESKTVKNKTVESNTIKGNTVENKTVESNNIKENSFESQTVESQTVETNTIKGNTVENKTVESNNIKDNSFESKTAESKITTNDSVESDSITVGSNIVESKTDESNTAESKITVNNTVERDTDEGGTVDRDTVESETITLNVEKETLEGTIIESNTVESKSTTNDTAEIDTVVSDIAESQTIESESVKSKTVISETNENKTTETKIVISKTADNKTVRIIHAKSAMVTSQNENAEEKTIENKNIEMSESDDQVEFCDNLPGQSDEQNETQLQNYLSSNSQSDILLTSLPSENQDTAEIKTTEIGSIDDVELCPDSKLNDTFKVKELKPILPEKDLSSCKIVGDFTANLESNIELSNTVDQCKTKTLENVKENTDADCQSKDLGDENANEESSVNVTDKNKMLSSNLEELETATAATNVPLGIQNLESQITFHNEELITVAAHKTTTEQSELIHGQKIVEINDQFDVNDINTNDILNETENAEDSTNSDDGLSKVSTVDKIYSSKTTEDRFEASSDKNIIQKNKLVTKNVEEKSDESDVDDDDSEADDNSTIEVEDNLSCAANGKSVISKDNTSNHDISAKVSSTKNSKILSEIANDWSDDSNHSDEVTQTEEVENISIEKVCESQLCESQIKSNDVDEKGQNIESEAIVVALESLTEEAAKEILEDSEDISEGTSKVIEKFVDTLAWKERVDPFDKLIETPKDKRKNPEKKVENAESALDLSVLVVEHAPPAMDKESKSVDFTDEDLVESDKMSFSEESEDRASINLPWESLVSESPRPHSGGPNGSGHSSKTSQISSNNSLVVRPSSIIRLDVDDEEKHPMEDVIDEFVEEIIEDERLEQIEETSKQKRSNRKSSKNAEKRKKSKQTAKRSNDETAKNKVSKRKRIIQSSNENSSKKSKVDEENSEKIPETAKTDLKLDDGDDISKIEEFVRTQILSAPIETKSRQETDPNKQVEKGEDGSCSNSTVDIEAKDEKQRKSSSRKKKRRTAMATNKKSKRAKNETEIQNLEGDIVEKENVEKDKNENDNLSNPEKETANVASQEADKEVTIVQEIQVEKPVEVQGTVESEKSKETQTLNQQPAASNDSNQTNDQSASKQKDQLNNPRSDSAIFKPVSDWKKVLKYPPNYTDLSNRLIDQQIFKNVLPPYAPCVPSNTSQNLIDHLTERELEQLSCPGCKDRFLLPSSFFQHLYRKSVLINFNCRPCGNVLMSFHNRCHLRTHVLSHLEVDGTSSVVIPDTDSLHVAPLDESQFGIGFVDETYTEELNVIHREHFRTSGQDSTQCPECRLTVNKSGLASHFQNLRKNSSVLECPDCRMNLPNKCSLEAHKRIHQQIAPFICPECGESFETLAFFKNHLASVCFHEARALAILCRLCTNKKSRQNLRQENNDKDPPSATNDNSNNVDEESYVSAKAILGHIYEAHVRMFYKCSFCSKAYVEKSDIYDHGKKMHTDKSDKIVRQKVCDFSLLYKASFLKPPNNLFCTREGFEKKMSNILSKWPKKFLLKCHQCSKYFESVEKFANHDSLWCQKRSRSPMASKLFPDLSNNSTDRRLSDRDRREEMIQHLAHLEALSANCNDCSKSTVDFRAHLTTHSNPSQARSTNQTRDSAAGPPAAVAPPTAVALPATQPAALTVALPVETPQASSATPTRVTRKGLENFSKRGSGSIDSRPGSATENRGSKRRRSQESASEPKDNPPKEDQPEERVENPAAEITIEEESVRIVSSPVVEPPKRKQGRVANVTKSGRTRRAELKPSVETLGLDVLSNKKLLAFNRLSREALVIGSTVRPIVDKSNKKQKRSKHKCGLCGYKTDCKNTFQTHIIIHKPVVSDATLSFMDTNYKPQEIGKETIQDCLQCKECGMCFASEPSWKKHLFLLHRIKNPGPEHYCMDLVPSTPGPGGLGIEEGDSSDSSLGRLIIDEGQFPCTVCGQDFVNPLELKRHFRTHGMAFLKLRHSPPYKKV